MSTTLPEIARSVGRQLSLAELREIAPDRLRSSAGVEAGRLAREAIGAIGLGPLEDHVLGDELRAAEELVQRWAADGCPR